MVEMVRIIEPKVNIYKDSEPASCCSNDFIEALELLAEVVDETDIIDLPTNTPADILIKAAKMLKGKDKLLISVFEQINKYKEQFGEIGDSDCSDDEWDDENPVYH